MDELAHILNTVGTRRLLVVGDLILDRYVWGAGERVSPEAPVLVLRAEHDEVRLGGAASVAMLLAALEVDVVLAGVVGDDPTGRTVLRLLDDARIERKLVLIDADRETTVKERIVGRTAGRQPHQIVRVDRETRRPIARSLEQSLIDGVVGRLPDCQAVCVADYNKGVCTPRLLHSVLGAAAQMGLPAIVDPARIADYSRYRRAALVKPNRAEAELASGRGIQSADDAIAAACKISRRFRLPTVVVTLDADGMVLAMKKHVGQHFPTAPREVCDVTGAGDMALAALGLGAASALSWPDAVQLANVAAGLQVERFGVTPISRTELTAALLAYRSRHAPRDVSLLEQGRSERGRVGGVGQNSHEFCYDSLMREPTATGVDTLAKLLSQLTMHRRAGRTIVFANGCFDLFHIGHLRLLQEAASLGDVLIVAINSDASVRQLKGPTRPIIGEKERAAIIAAFAFVDHVVIYDDPTPHWLLETIRPDVLVKGGTYAPHEVVGHEIVAAYGGRIHLAAHVEGVSTTRIIERMVSQAAEVLRTKTKDLVGSG